MKTKFYAFGAAFALLATSALTYAALDGLSVKRVPKEGQEFKVRVKADLVLAGNPATFNALMAEKITKVDTDGSYTEEEHQIEAKAKFGDTEVDVPGNSSHSTTYNADGSLKSIAADGDASGPAGYRMTDLSLLIDAGKPLNVGDTWTVDIKADAKTGAEAAKAEYKVLGEEKVGEFDTIKIKATVKETTTTDPASSEGTYWISKVDGSQVKAELKWMNVPFPGAPGPINATVTMQREG